jgi:quercetin dioxygenase-like cupin family protein
VIPYTDNFLSEDERIRVFLEGVEEEDLIWHRDERDREVEVLGGTGWMIQFENELPKTLYEGDVISIPKMEYHRLIRGEDSLTIRILEQ